MTVERRVAALESKMVPRDERQCFLIVDSDTKWPTRCPYGTELDASLSKCDTCTVRPENRHHLIIEWVEGEPKE